MRKIKALLILGFIFVFGTFFTIKVNAFTLSPASGTLSGTQQIQIRASSSGTDSSAVSIVLNVTGMTVTGYSDAAGMISIGTCAGDATFTSSSVCVDVAAGDDFTAGQLIGTITVSASGSAATVTAASGSEYEDGTEVSGVLGTYNSGTSTGGTLPNTSISNNNLLPLFLGFFFISLGALTFYAYPELRRRYS